MVFKRAREEVIDFMKPCSKSGKYERDQYHVRGMEMKKVREFRYLGNIA